MQVDRYTSASAKRDKYVAAVLESPSKKKVVVAGPGTGKTYLFKKVLEGRPHSLTLTFINALVDDLSVELSGISEVRTLHSFARELLRRLWKKKEIRIFPRLSDVINEDLKILKGQQADFSKIFHTRDDNNNCIEFYKDRKKYYDDSYGYSDIVFAAVKYLEAHPEAIPAYDQIVVDEFQDFNLLETSLIELLAQRSPVLVAGDDDQALYDFKQADPRHIRELHAGTEYEAFNLPMCSRCTRVVVDAANDIVKSASASELLHARIPKPYEYFDDAAKDKISEQYPTLTHRSLYASQFAWYISQQLEELVKHLRERFAVLIISPARVQARSIANSLKEKGFEAVDFVEKADPNVSLLDGLKLLLNDSKCNLGWRVVAGLSLDANEFADVLKKTEGSGAQALIEVVPSECKNSTKQALTALRAVRDGKDIDEGYAALLKKWGIDPFALGLEGLRRDLTADNPTAVRPGLRKIPIKITTIQGSKGLSADVVFITHLDDPFWISKGGMTDKDVCNFVVALTRAKKRVTLLSSQKATPTFISWIEAERISNE